MREGFHPGLHRLPASIDGRASRLDNPRLIEYHESGGEEKASEIRAMSCFDKAIGAGLKTL
jgi:hypothetical protein